MAHSHLYPTQSNKMQSVQRQFGKLMSKGPGNNAKVAVLLTDYEDADKVLVKVGRDVLIFLIS